MYIIAYTTVRVLNGIPEYTDHWELAEDGMEANYRYWELTERSNVHSVTAGLLLRSTHHEPRAYIKAFSALLIGDNGQMPTPTPVLDPV